MESDAGKLLLMSFVGFLAIKVGISGHLGSVLGAIVDPANMTSQVINTNFGGGAGGSFADTSYNVPSSGTLTASQIKQVALNAGFTPGQAMVATAIALAESGGRANATNTDSNGTVDRGLWQINSVHQQFTASKLFDPLYNAQAAYQVSNSGTNWLPWATFTSGAYVRFLSEAQGA